MANSTKINLPKVSVPTEEGTDTSLYSKDLNALLKSVDALREERKRDAELELDSQNKLNENIKVNYSKADKTFFERSTSAVKRVKDKTMETGKISPTIGMGLAMATGGIINPVLLQALFEPFAKTINFFKNKDVKTSDTAETDIWNKKRDSSALEKSKDSPLFDRLDIIIGLLSKQTSVISPEKEEKKESTMNKILKALGLAAVGFGIVKKFGGQIKEAWDNSAVGKRVNKSIGNIKDAYTKDGIGGALKAGWEETKLLGSELWNKTKAWYEQSDLKVSVDAMMDKVKNWLDGIWKGIKDWWNNFSFKELWDDTVKLTKSLADKIVSWWKADGEKAESGEGFSVHGMLSRIGDWFKDIWKGVKDWWNDFSLAELWEDMTKYAGKLKDLVVSWWNGDSEKAESGKGFSIHGIFDSIGNWFKDIWKGVKDWWNSFSISDLWGKIANFSTDLASRVVSWWKGDGKEDKDAEGFSLAGMFKKIGDWFGNIWKGIKDWWNGFSFGNLFGKNKEDDGPGLIKKSTDFIKGIWDKFDFKKTVSDSIDGISNAFSSAWSGIKNWWNDSWIKKKLDKNEDKTSSDKVEVDGEDLGSKFTNLLKDFDVLGLIKKFVTGYLNLVSNAYKSVFNFAKKIFGFGEIDLDNLETLDIDAEATSGVSAHATLDQTGKHFWNTDYKAVKLSDGRWVKANDEEEAKKIIAADKARVEAQEAATNLLNENHNKSDGFTETFQEETLAVYKKLNALLDELTQKNYIDSVINNGKKLTEELKNKITGNTNNVFISNPSSGGVKQSTNNIANSTGN